MNAEVDKWIRFLIVFFLCNNANRQLIWSSEGWYISKSLGLDQDLFDFMAIFQYIFLPHITNRDGKIVPLICSPQNVHLMQTNYVLEISENNFLETVSCWQRKRLYVNTQHTSRTLINEVQQWKYYSQWYYFLSESWQFFILRWILLVAILSTNLWTHPHASTFRK